MCSDGSEAAAAVEELYRGGVPRSRKILFVTGGFSGTDGWKVRRPTGCLSCICEFDGGCVLESSNVESKVPEAGERLNGRQIQGCLRSFEMFAGPGRDLNHLQTQKKRWLLSQVCV